MGNSVHEYAYLRDDKTDYRKKVYGKKGEKVIVVKRREDHLAIVENIISGERYFVPKSILSQVKI